VTGIEGRWTGFVLVVAPLVNLTVDADELFREVTAQVESDVLLQDTVRVGRSAGLQGGDRDVARILDAIARASIYRNGRMFAPRAAFGCVVVGDDAEQARGTVRRLADAPELQRLHVNLYDVVARPAPLPADDAVPPDDVPARPAPDGDERGARAETDRAEADRAARPVGPDAATVSDVVAKATALMESYEQVPGRSIPARMLISLMRPATPPVEPAPAASPSRILDDRLDGPSVVYGPPAVDEPRARPAATTQAEVLDQLADVINSVALVYLVVTPDRDRVSRRIRRRRTEMLVELDRALAAARPEPAVGEPSTAVEVALLTAGRRLTRHGLLRTAGALTAGQLPKISADHFDIVKCVDDLLELYERDAASLHRRGINLVGTHAIFVSTSAPLGDSVSIKRFERLSQAVRVRWILLSDARRLMSDQYQRAGVRVFEEHPDVANELVTTAFTADAVVTGRPPTIRPTT
jgi:hypothetical protein